MKREFYVSIFGSKFKPNAVNNLDVKFNESQVSPHGLSVTSVPITSSSTLRKVLVFVSQNLELFKNNGAEEILIDDNDGMETLSIPIDELNLHL